MGGRAEFCAVSPDFPRFPDFPISPDFPMSVSPGFLNGEEKKMKKRTKDMVVKIEILFVAVVFTFFLLEGIVRVFFKDQIDPKALSRQFYTAVGYVEFSENPVLILQMKKNIETIDRNVHIRTDENGYRVSTVALESPNPSAIKIAVVGDSTAFGWGIEYEDTYTCSLARKMGKETGKDVVVKNYCVPGYNTIQELEVYRTKIKQWKPDLLLIHHDNNDPETYGQNTFSAVLTPEYGDNRFHCALYKFSRRTIKRSILQTKNSIWRSKHQFVKIRESLYVSGGPIYDEHVKALDALINEAEADGTQAITILGIFCVFQNDEESQNVYEKLHQPLEQHLLDNGKNVWDMYKPALKKIQESGLSDTISWWVSPETRDYHLNTIGHEFVAESLKDYCLSNEKIMSIFK
jgi:hypothetical protein